MAHIICPDDLLINEEGKYEWTLERATDAHRKCHDAWQRELFMRRPERAILLIGAPGAGKSTWAKGLGDENVVVFDATLNLPYKRRPLVQMAHKERIDVHFVLFLTPLHICLERNSGRREDRKIPEAIIKDMDRKIRMSPPQKLRENYQRLDVVRTSDAGTNFLQSAEHRPYRFRGLPCTIVPGDALWCVTGLYTTEGGDGGGVLEWCRDEGDAQRVLRSMEQDLTLSNLRAAKYEATQ